MSTERLGRGLIVGLGQAGRATAAAWLARGGTVVAVDDSADRPATAAAAAELGIEVHATPDGDDLTRLVAGCDAVLPSPAVPWGHPVRTAAAEAGVVVIGEMDLARMWHRAPSVAITGTNGKTTVTTLITEIARAGDIDAVACGNNELPWLTAIDAHPDTELWVVEASSFRLADTVTYRPDLGVWLNLAPDHLDWHPGMAHYEASKAAVWSRQHPDDVAIGVVSDPIVATHLATAPAERVAVDGPGGWRVVDGEIRDPAGYPLVEVAALARQGRPDLINAMVGLAAGRALGVADAVAVDTIVDFAGLPHRVQPLGHSGGVTFYDDSKATSPHATLACLESFPSAVLIAGGRNKGLDLSVLGEAAPRLRAVVAIGEAAAEVQAAFASTGVAVVGAASMDAAVARAAEAAEPGDAVVLSPACASFDWYSGYAERGDDFARAVAEHIAADTEETR